VKRTDDTNDPRTRALDDALTLWADEARATGARADTTRLADAVQAHVLADPHGIAAGERRAPFAYAAAAAALLAVGLTGAWLARPDVPSPTAPGASVDLEQGSLAVLRLIELNELRIGR
jgi:hypothetical protein